MSDQYEHVRRYPLNVVLAALGFETFKYRKAGTEGYGACPIHGSKKNTTCFSFDDDGKWNCFSCGAHGWLTRDRAALADRSSRPQHQPRRTSEPVAAAIIALRRTRATAWQISHAFGVPRSTATRVLARAGLNRVALVEPAGPVQRYEWPHVGD